MLTYAFWNNKGGTGKTSLAFQAICRYAEKHPRSRVLVIDACPQANLSELFLGGLTGAGSANLLTRHGLLPIRCSLGGYFQLRLPSPFQPPAFRPQDFFTDPASFNNSIPANITLMCGDPLLELQSNAMNTLANAQLVGVNTFVAVTDWLSQFLHTVSEDFDIAFIDCNPSFSMYTQIALAASDRIVLPVMADDSSRRAVQNALSLVYGLSLPSPIYAEHAFSSRLNAANKPLPKVHMIAKNRITQYMGPASAYYAVLTAIDGDIAALQRTNPNLFTFTRTSVGMVEIKDFQTTGVVAFAKGQPFSALRSGKSSISGHRVQVRDDYRRDALAHIDALVAKL
jgi:cellulose biosynthesis protein BcsQ